MFATIENFSQFKIIFGWSEKPHFKLLKMVSLFCFRKPFFEFVLLLFVNVADFLYDPNAEKYF
jgi:hypothetical protein